MKVDNELAIVALRVELMERLLEGASPVETPARESESNGGVEIGVKSSRGYSGFTLQRSSAKSRGTSPARILS